MLKTIFRKSLHVSKKLPTFAIRFRNEAHNKIIEKTEGSTSKYRENYTRALIS